MRLFEGYHRRRAELLLASDVITPVDHNPAPARVPSEEVLIPAFCSLYGEPALIVAEKIGNQVRLLRSELMPPGFDSGPVPPLVDLGSFKLDGKLWTGCAHCGAKSAPEHKLHSTWFCTCKQCTGILNCPGNHDGQFRTACGRLTDMRALTVYENTPVLGWPSNAGVRPATFRPEPPLSLSLAPMPQIAAPQSTVLQIGFRGKR